MPVSAPAKTQTPAIETATINWSPQRAVVPSQPIVVAKPPERPVVINPTRQSSTPATGAPVRRGPIPALPDDYDPDESVPLKIEVVPTSPAPAIKQPEVRVPSNVEVVPPSPAPTITLPEIPVPAKVDAVPALPVPAIKPPEAPSRVDVVAPLPVPAVPLPEIPASAKVEAVPALPVPAIEPPEAPSRFDVVAPLPVPAVPLPEMPAPAKVEAVPALAMPAAIKPPEVRVPAKVDVPVTAIPLPEIPAPSRVDAVPALPVSANRPQEKPLPVKADTPPLGRPGSLTIEDPDEFVPIPIPKSETNVGPRETHQVVIAPAIPALPNLADHDARANEKPVSRQNQPYCGHSEDFKTVIGQVQIWRNTVRLRYASIDQEDQYGGFIVLQGSAEVAKLREGQLVRVRGVLIPPENRTRAAQYTVQVIEMLD
jgi:hypothetical protein